MRRKLVMIRHAKSSWGNPLQSDFDRPLNDRGKSEAPEMGKKINKAGLIPDLIIASSAKRTRQTAKRIAEEVGYDVSKIRWEEKLYHCIPSVFREMLYEVGDDIGTVFIVAHNPGITEYVNQLSPDLGVENMPPCGVVGVQFEADEWNRLDLVHHKVIFFEFPGKES